MIEYKQLENGEPADVELITDDSNGEMSDLEDMIRECDYEETVKLPNDREEDGKFHIIIPGKEAGEFSEMVYEIDNGKLEDLTDQWNREALTRAEQDD